ncbi:hypothetical protein ACWFPY_25330 [Nocardia fluminea]
MTGPNELILQSGGLPWVINPAGFVALNTMLEQLPQKLGTVASRSKLIEDALAEQGADPDYAKTVDQFGAMSHQQIYDAVHGQGGMDVAGLQTVRAVWQSSSAELSTGAQTAWTQADALFSAGEWAGESGAAAQAASQRLVKTVDLVAQVFAAVEARVDGLSCAAEAIRAAISAPTAVSTGLNPDDPLSQVLPGLVNPETATTERTKVDQATVGARAAMAQLYSPNFPPAGSGVPMYPTVQPIGQGGDNSVPGTAGSGSGTPSSTAATSSGGDSIEDATEQQQTSGDPGENTAGDEAGSGSDSSTDSGASSAAAGDDGSGQATNPAETTAAGLGSNTAGDTPASPNGSGAGGPRGGGSVPFGVPVGGGFAGVPSPGAAIPGIGQPAPLGTTGTPNVAAGSAGGGRAGVGPMGPMMPGAGQRRGAGGDGDGEHQSPEYLRRVHSDWVDGIIGISPVIGYDPDAQTSSAPTAGSSPLPPPPPPQLAAVPPVADPSSVASAEHAAETPTAQPVPPRQDTPGEPVAPTETASPPGVSPEVASLLASYGWGGSAPDPARGSEQPVPRSSGERSS